MRFIKTLPLAAAALLALPGVAAAHDRNHDGLPDRWEKAHHLSLKFNQAKRDQDRDGLNNRGEFRARTDPRNADTDGDGVNDEQENAGRVTDFTNGVLTLTLADGSTLKGAVTADTEVKCEGAAGADNHGEDRAHMARDGGGNGDGEHNSGGGDEADGDNNQGDDNGDQQQPSATPCTIAVGDFVREADVKATPSGPVFEEVQLAK
jgi:hypothetical protein